MAKAFDGGRPQRLEKFVIGFGERILIDLVEPDPAVIDSLRELDCTRLKTTDENIGLQFKVGIGMRYAC